MLRKYYKKEKLPMPMINVDVNDSVEPKVVEPEKYEVRIVSVKMDKDKNGDPYILPRFEVVDDPYAKEFSHFFRLPTSDMTEKQRNTSKFNLKKFFQCFGITTDQEIDCDTLPGYTGWVELGVKDSGDEFGEQNFVKQFIVSN